ncbi:TetR/AcrR family transcriptional regulator C-terminal domain-containing protein [Actinobaculum sp. 313]|uniref:TetR/AcrR family transcriptional regulator C-terminal domain-containing protein n=1 Tax=Actinobaculum sp. 313 TaxID=2495645 RepID=UPI0013DE4B94|nr:TetR/AcrR family transcriptional regulator C-terminal domain-containing protein [Actinobaculum sp. 313]
MANLDTKLAFAASFRALAVRRDVDKITVGEIAAGAGRSPATFYRHFRDKYDLAAWDYARDGGAIMAHVGDDDYPWPRTLLDGAAYFQRHRAYLRNLLTHTNGRDSFMRHMMATNVALLRDCVADVVKPDQLDPETLICIRIYCYGTVQLVCDWIMESIHCTPEQLAHAMEVALPEPLRRVLLDGGGFRE